MSLSDNVLVTNPVTGWRVMRMIADKQRMKWIASGGLVRECTLLRWKKRKKMKRRGWWVNLIEASMLTSRDHLPVKQVTGFWPSRDDIDSGFMAIHPSVSKHRLSMLMISIGEWFANYVNYSQQYSMNCLRIDLLTKKVTVIVETSTFRLFFAWKIIWWRCYHAMRD